MTEPDRREFAAPGTAERAGADAAHLRRHWTGQIFSHTWVADSTMQASVLVDGHPSAPGRLVHSDVAPDRPKVKPVSSEFDDPAADPRAQADLAPNMPGEDLPDGEAAAVGEVAPQNIEVLRGPAAERRTPPNRLAIHDFPDRNPTRRGWSSGSGGRQPRRICRRVDVRSHRRGRHRRRRPSGHGGCPTCRLVRHRTGLFWGRS